MSYNRRNPMSTPVKGAASFSKGKDGSSLDQAIDLTDEPPMGPSTKRKLQDEPSIQKPAASSASLKTPSTPSSSTRKKKQKTTDAGGSSTQSEEKRLRRFRAAPTNEFNKVYFRATTQRFYVLSRWRHGTEECPEERIELTGSTGNIYTLNVGKEPQCNCPHALQGNQCKHILYVLGKVLHARFDLVYQLALLSSELRKIFDNAPPIASSDGSLPGPPPSSSPSASASGAESDKRKPIEGDCPICYSEMKSPNARSGEAIVWCAASCGQNMHQECFRMWARTKNTGDVTCPMCRSVWQGDDGVVSRIQREKGDTHQGYVNVADQLGISRARDVSTYHQFYEYLPSGGRRRKRRQFWRHDDDDDFLDDL